MQRLLRLVALAALAGCAVHRPVAGPAAAAPAERAPRVFEYRVVGAETLHAFVFAPSTGAIAPAILLFHGGGWSAGSADWVFPAAQRFADLGLVAIAIDYRLAGAKTTPVDALADTCAAFAWARSHAGELRLDPHRVAGYGVSAGGHLVAAAATVGCGTASDGQPVAGPDALVLWSPALDVAADPYFVKILQGRSEARDASPIDHVHPSMPPVSIVEGEKDSLTPLAKARLFCDRVQEAGGRCELNVYPGLGHLLTRNLANQESDFDPDPVARQDAIEKQDRFLIRLWSLKAPAK
jgi:acetyl esterase